MTKTVKLSNAVEISEEFSQRISDDPPNYQQIAQLHTEDYVKLKANSEYFWVKVDAVDPFVGIVQGDPTFQQKFMKGDKIYFESDNVYDLRSRWWLNNELF